MRTAFGALECFKLRCGELTLSITVLQACLTQLRQGAGWAPARPSSHSRCQAVGLCWASTSSWVSLGKGWGCSVVGQDCRPHRAVWQPHSHGTDRLSEGRTGRPER